MSRSCEQAKLQRLNKPIISSLLQGKLAFELVLASSNKSLESVLSMLFRGADGLSEDSRGAQQHLTIASLWV